MAEFIFDRGELTVVVLRIPRRLWDRWEYQHRDFGQAVHAARESLIEIIAGRVARGSYGPREPFGEG